MFNNESHIRVYCKRISVISKKELPFNFPNHGLVEIIKDTDFYRLAFLYVDGEKKSEFNVIRIQYVGVYYKNHYKRSLDSRHLMFLII